MKMKAACIALLILAAPAAFAVIPVTVDAIVDPNYIFNQSQQLLNLVATAKQTYSLVTQAEQMAKYAGDPMSAVKGMVDMSSFNADLTTSIGGGTSYLPGSLNTLASTMAQAQGGFQVRLHLVATDSGSAAADDAAIAAQRQIVLADGTTTMAPTTLYASLDSAEAVARSIKAALLAQNSTRAQASQAYIKVNLRLGSAQNESEKQAAAAQLQAIAAQQALLNGQTQQQQFEYQLQKDKDARTADNANITDQHQAIVNANSVTDKSAADDATAKQNLAASRTRVAGDPIGLDYTLIK